MKRWTLHMMVVLMFLSIGTVFAVEKKPKEPASPPKKEESVQVQPKDAKPADPKSNKQVQPKPQKKYDDFVDRNNNGVDDRKENLKKKN